MIRRSIYEAQKILRRTDHYDPAGHTAGMKVKDLVRKQGTAEQTFYWWKSKYGGMDVSYARKLKSLEVENARLKELPADQMLDNTALK